MLQNSKHIGFKVYFKINVYFKGRKGSIYIFNLL